MPQISCIALATPIRAVAVALALAVIVSAAPASAALINVQFGATTPNASKLQVGGAVLGSATSQWNYFTTATGSAPLVTAGGLASGISLAFTSPSAYGVVPQNSGFYNTPYANLMQSFINTRGGAFQLTLTGLAASQAFTLDLYGQSDMYSSNYGETFTANGVSAIADNSSAASTFINGVNFVQLSGVATAAGTIGISVARAPGRDEADLNGFQLLTVPEPASLAILGAGLAGIAASRRRRRVIAD